MLRVSVPSDQLLLLPHARTKTIVEKQPVMVVYTRRYSRARPRPGGVRCCWMSEGKGTRLVVARSPRKQAARLLRGFLS